MAPPDPAPKPSLAPLDGVRALANAGVVLFHTFLYWAWLVPEAIAARLVNESLVAR